MTLSLGDHVPNVQMKKVDKKTIFVRFNPQDDED
jgi:hypothetical protein